MKRSPLVLLLALAACAPAAAPSNQQPPTVVTPLMLEPPPIYSLLGFRDRLELTSEQIVSLDSIAVAAHAQNQTLIRDLHERSEPTRSQVALVVGDSAKPVLEQIRENNRQAALAVGEVLSPEQESTACQLFDMERDDEAGGDQPQRPERRDDRRARRRRGPRGGIQLDTALLMMQRRIWPWCSASAPVR